MPGNVEEEYLRLVFEVKGQAEHAALQKQLQATNQTIADLSRQFQQGYITKAQYDKGMKDATASAKALTRELRALQLAIDKADKAAAKAAKSTKGFGNPSVVQGIQATSYAIQDFSSASGGLAQKLNAVSNNIPGMLMMFGSSGPLALGIMAVSAVAIGLYQNWNNVLWLFGQGHEIPKAAKDLDGLKDQLERVKTELKELEKLGYLSTSQLGHYNNLKAEEKALKDQVKAEETIKRLREKKSQGQEDLAKAFEEALAEVGPEKFLAKLEASIKDTSNPALKGLYHRLVNQLEKGDLESFKALQEFALTLGEEGKHLASAMDNKFNEIRKAREQPMEEAVKAWKAQKRESDEALERGREELADIYDDVEKKIQDGVKEVLTEPLQDLLVRSRANGVGAKKEAAYLKTMIETEAKKLYPDLAKSFPEAFGTAVTMMKAALIEGMDRTIEKIAQAENLTKLEAARRLERERQRKAEGQQGELAQDEMEKFVQQAHNATRVPGQAPLTAEQRKAIAEQMRQGMRNAGMTPQQQAAFGKMINNPNFRPIVPKAMQEMMGQGMGMEQAAQFLPQVMNRIVGQFARGAKQANVGAAVDQVIAQLIQNQAKMANQFANMQPGRRAQLRAAQEIGQLMNAQADPGQNFGNFPP